MAMGAEFERNGDKIRGQHQSSIGRNISAQWEGNQSAMGAKIQSSSMGAPWGLHGSEIRALWERHGSTLTGRNHLSAMGARWHHNQKALGAR